MWRIELNTWWRHQMETFSASLAICAGNSPVPGEFLAQRPVTRSFDAFFDLRLNKRLSKQSLGWWSETLSRPLWRHCNVMHGPHYCWWRGDDFRINDLLWWESMGHPWIPLTAMRVFDCCYVVIRIQDSGLLYFQHNNNNKKVDNIRKQKYT